MDEIEELLKHQNPSSDLLFKNFDGSQKKSLPPTPISSLFNKISNSLFDSSDKGQSKMSIMEINTRNRSSSANSLIKKKESKYEKLKRADTDVSIFKLSDREVDCIPESKQRKEKKYQDSQSLNNTFQSNEDDENGDGFLRLSVRQPSFSNLTAGHLIVKGVDENEPQLDKVDEEVNPVIILTEQTEPDQLPITLQVREASKSHFDITESINLNDNNISNQTTTDSTGLLDSIARKNAERLRRMGYNPDESIKSKNIDRTSATNSSDSQKNKAFLAHKLNNSKKEFDNKRIKRVTSAGSDFKDPVDDIYARNGSENEEDLFDSSKNFYKGSSGEANERISSLGLDANDNSANLATKKKNISKKDRPNTATKTRAKSGKTNGWNPNSISKSSTTIDSDLVEHEFGSEEERIKPPPIDLKTVKTQQYFHNSNDDSPMPQRLDELIYKEFHANIPEESVAYLALQGSDVIGYKESRINEAMFMLRYLLKRCINLGYITESAYVQGVIEKTIRRQNEFKKFNKVNPSKIVQENLTTAKVKKEAKEKTWNARIVAANSEYEIAVNDLKKRYDEEKNLLDKKWHSKSAFLKYRKPSSSLNQMKFVAKKMLDTHRFEEAAALSKSIEENEKNEALVAAKRMNNDYKSALAKLDKKYKSEEVALKTQFDARKLTLVKRENAEMLPIDRQVEKLTNQKEQIDDSRKRNQDSSKVTVYMKKRKSSLAKSSMLPPNLTINASLKLNLNSALPSSGFNSAKRRTQSRLSRPISNRLNRSSDLSQIYD